MIVKVQLPLLEGDGALIFNEDKSLVLDVPVTTLLEARMGKRRRAHFQADMVDEVLELGDALPDQGW